MKIKRGVTRTCVLIGKYAIKVPRLKHFINSQNGEKYYTRLSERLWMFCRGVLANQSEKDWSYYPDSKDEVAPVLYSWFGGIINIYPRAEPFLGDDYAAQEAWAAMDFKTPSDVKPQNFGYLKGKLVWLDYAMDWNDCPHDC